ncbi:MAG TPA: ester cyclase [Tetrasphaera sp.]|uniref:ester cyclase n=1 Tax=Nostocoides sp. TaxID=1917966 RepID=UPI002BD9418F|nr:ester cyclase [Tetrasphaera sp.]HNQ08042.1 ester cyclase [Tetrasphaera sp.]
MAHADRAAVLERYARYLAAYNSRAWSELGSHVADEVLVNGRMRTRTKYVADLQILCESFPDYRWTLVRVLADGDWLAVHVHDTGTRQGAFAGAPGDGTAVETDEFAMYRFGIDGRIREVEVTTDNARLIREAPGERG